MAIEIRPFILGPIENNTYLISDKSSGEAVLVDPAVPSKEICGFLEKNHLVLKEVWITHAHFDHIGGVQWFLEQCAPQAQAVMHQEAIPLWKTGGGAEDFGFEFDPGNVPEKIITENDVLNIGSSNFTVLHTPGHTPGHVTFYSPQDAIAFCGDLIFYHSVGRTDLGNSDSSKLLKTIREKNITLPEHTVLYPGHGPFTTVGEEKANNPFL
ncbi:MAG: MBL fold metallo-hydrolase [Deltaproteobacteria bacterium]|nr:MBL fold metallo-hydrolase [Deltaproteobacteria bacterium]